MLREWGLVHGLKKAVDLTLGTNQELAGATTSVNPGAGVAFVYAGVKGQSVARIAGASLNDVPTEERYTMRTTLVVGDDYRVHWSSDSIYFELVTPPTSNGIPISANEDEDPFEILFAMSFPSEGATSPPIVKAQVEEHAKHNIAWNDYQGFWRSALVIDFGKNLPAFVEDKHALPARDFVAAVAEAFRGRVVEVGEFY